MFLDWNSGQLGKKDCVLLTVQKEVYRLKEVPLANGQTGTQVVDDAIDLIRQRYRFTI